MHHVVEVEMGLSSNVVHLILADHQNGLDLDNLNILNPLLENALLAEGLRVTYCPDSLPLMRLAEEVRFANERIIHRVVTRQFFVGTRRTFRR